MSELKDPRVLFAAERTMLAWNRTSLAMIALGYLIERAHVYEAAMTSTTPTRADPVVVVLGTAFIVAGAISAAFAAWQFRRVLATLNEYERPRDYSTNFSLLINLLVALLGLALAAYVALVPR